MGQDHSETTISGDIARIFGIENDGGTYGVTWSKGAGLLLVRCVALPRLAELKISELAEKTILRELNLSTGVSLLTVWDRASLRVTRLKLAGDAQQPGRSIAMPVELADPLSVARRLARMTLMTKRVLGS